MQLTQLKPLETNKSFPLPKALRLVTAEGCHLLIWLTGPRGDGGGAALICSFPSPSGES